MSFVITHQLALIAGFFALGTLGALFLFRRGAGPRAWKLADLVWVVVGGLGALTALLAGVYRTDSVQLNRQIDVAYAATRAFDTEAARFRLLYCDAGAPGPDLRTLCEKVEFLSASTAENRDLPLFLEVTRISAPLQGLTLFTRPRQGTEDHYRMMEEVHAFDPARFLAFAAEDDATRSAAARLDDTPDSRVIAVEFRLIADAYDDLIGKVGRLKTEWEYLQANTQFLTAQILALCMVAFAAPFRFGKSVVELR